MDSCISKTLVSEAHVPSSTYRLQMFDGFTFDDASEIVVYLAKLGIGDAYLSPIFQARPHSTHGYDVMRHDSVNSELGGQAGFDRFSGKLKAEGLGLLLDIVPNHMGIGNDADWWQDVLANGRSSRFARYFDIDWEPLKPDLRNKLLLPVLGTQYGEALEAKEIQLAIVDGRPVVTYFERRFPIAPQTIALLFQHKSEGKSSIPQSLLSILRELEEFSLADTGGDSDEQTLDLQSNFLQRLDHALKRPEVVEQLEEMIPAINGTKGDPQSFDALHQLLEAQHYRLASWRTSSEQINYRRFFDVNDLVGLRMEEPYVFAKTHSLIRRLIAEGKVTGLRVDHCDGMFNPRIYLERLQKLFIGARCYGPVANGQQSAVGGIEQEVLTATEEIDWRTANLPLYCVVEKILEPGENLPRIWAVQGTSGYDFVHVANQLFIQEKNKKRFDQIYSSFLRGRTLDPAQVIYESKRNVMFNSLASETHVLTNLLSRLAQDERRFRDFTDDLLETAIREMIACFPIYRTYIDEQGEYSAADTTVIRLAVRLAKRRNPDVDSSVFDYLRRILLLEDRGNGNNQRDAAALQFALKFQQLTGPVMAKGVEDTSFYVYCRFISSNEVGSAIDAFGLSADKLHESNRRRAEQAPYSMLTTSTHDTKRSEDVRNRLNVLSEMPDKWESLTQEWSLSHEAFKTILDDGTVAPDSNEQYLIYQTIVGAWPWLESDRQDFTERLKAYVGKALSEAKVNVSWINPRPEYTEAVQLFIDRLLNPQAEERPSSFVRELEAFLQPVKIHGAVNSLAQLTLKVTSPGVPDFYQGCELWDLSLVDPDNRRPVDYASRSRALEEFESWDALDSVRLATDDLASGRIKLLTMYRALAIRKDYLLASASNDYTALTVSDQEHLIAYMRGESVMVILPRFTYTLCKGQAVWPVGKYWENLTVDVPDSANGSWINTLTGIKCEISGSLLKAFEIFAHIPIAILIRAN